MRNPLTVTEKANLKEWANVQFIIARKYKDINLPRSEFYHGRSVAAGKIAAEYNPKFRKSTVGDWILLGKLKVINTYCWVCGRKLRGEQLVYSNKRAKKNIAVCSRCVGEFQKQANPIRHTKEGWYWGSVGPQPTRKELLAQIRAIYAGGYKGRNPADLYQLFHGNPPIRERRVKYQPPKGKLIKWGKISQINYIPEYPSQHANVEFYHKFGDYGTLKFGKERPILATDKSGTYLYIIKDRSKFRLTDRGIVG